MKACKGGFKCKRRVSQDKYRICDKLCDGNKERASLTSTDIPLLRVLWQRRTVAEAPCLEHPKNRDCLHLRTGSNVNECVCVFDWTSTNVCVFDENRLESTYKCHFGRRLPAWSRLEQKRAQFHRSSERDAYNAAFTVSVCRNKRRLLRRNDDLQLIVCVRLDRLHTIRNKSLSRRLHRSSSSQTRIYLPFARPVARSRA